MVNHRHRLRRGIEIEDTDPVDLDLHHFLQMVLTRMLFLLMMMTTTAHHSRGIFHHLSSRPVACGDLDAAAAAAVRRTETENDGDDDRHRCRHIAVEKEPSGRV